MSPFIRAALVAAFLLSGCQAAPPSPGAAPGAPSVAAGGETFRLKCAPRDAILAGLEGHGEDLQDAGVMSDGLLAETFANPETGTWTWVVTLPDGGSCLLAWGTAWRARVDWQGEEAAE